MKKASLSLHLYHGTDPESAADLMACKVDINAGGGEFGRGFYLGSSKRLAKRRAFHKTEGRLGSAAEAMIWNNKNTYYVHLDEAALFAAFRGQVNNKARSIDLYHEVKRKNAQGLFRPPHDFIAGLIVGTRRYYDISQYKFQTPRTQDLFNLVSYIKLSKKLL